MPVTVSLLELVSIPGTKPAWPSEFRGFVETIESAPDERTNYLVLADWLRDHGEEWLEKACRYFAKNETFRMEKRNWGWELLDAPRWLASVDHGIFSCLDTPAGVLAELGMRLRKLADELS